MADLATFASLCGFCLEEHRGACAHPDCPIACTASIADAPAQARPAPSPTQPSVVATVAENGDPAETWVAARPTPRDAARRPVSGRRPAPSIATQPSVAHASGEPPGGRR